MRLHTLELRNYRNCLNLTLDFNSEKVLILGKNAQGKTNILESIYFISTLKSPRITNNSELINFGEDTVQISADIIKSETDINLNFSYNKEKQRVLKLNGVKTTPKNFKSVLKTVLFSSEDLMLLRGNPSDRRDWLDNAISQIYPAYDERLSKYDKIRIQKNNCLKEYLKTGSLNEDLLDVYNEQFAITGSNILYLRLKYLNEIEKYAEQKHRVISESETLGINYEGSFEISPNMELNDIAQKFKEAMNERKYEEMRRGQACIGPHRDDILFSINGEDATKFASQGQQRTVVLALKLSELDIITSKTGEEPVLLLDDVLAELDDIRQNYLLKSINTGTQTIITSVDTLLFEKEFLDGVKIYKIENGNLIS